MIPAVEIADLLLSAGIRIWAAAIGREPTEDEIKARIARARRINAIPTEDYEKGEVTVEEAPIPAQAPPAPVTVSVTVNPKPETPPPTNPT